MLSLFQYAVTLKVIQGMYSGITTVELDTLAAEISASMTTKHVDYGKLAARIAISNLHKETKKKFSGKYFLIIQYTLKKHTLQLMKLSDK